MVRRPFRNFMMPKRNVPSATGNARADQLLGGEELHQVDELVGIAHRPQNWLRQLGPKKHWQPAEWPVGPAQHPEQSITMVISGI